MTATFVPAPPLRVPLVDKDGVITRPWQVHFLARHNQAGGSTDKIDAAHSAALAAAPGTAEVVAIDGLQRGGEIGSNVAVGFYRTADLLANLPTTGNTEGDWAYATDTASPMWWTGGAWNAVTGGGGGGPVTTSGAPAAGNLTKFSGATSITNGNLSGDVTTSGTLVTTLKNTGPGAGSYTLASITIDAQGRVTAASSGTAGVSTLAGTWFGDGSDGDVTIAAGTTTLTRDTYYHNLTITGGTLNLGGFRVFVSNILDLSSAPAGAIRTLGTGSALIDGGNAATSSGGTNGANGLAGSSGGGGAAGSAGAAGGTGAGTQAGSAGAQVNTFNTGISGTSGAGGAVGGTAGGIARTGITPTVSLDIRYADQTLAIFSAGTWTQIKGGTGAPGGGSGAGDGTGNGGGGGGGGGAAGVTQIFANIINRGGSTAAGAISVKGGNGGTGGTMVSGGTNNGGGGGGAGAAGGWAQIVYGSLTGSVATNMIDASGGNGGAGGNGRGTGLGGVGGDAGGQGGVDLYNVTAGTSSINRGSAAKVSGNAASSGTGGTAQTNTYQVSL